MRPVNVAKYGVVDDFGRRQRVVGDGGHSGLMSVNIHCS